MSFRAVISGLVLVAIICGLTYFNDYVVNQTPLIGNNMPISVYGLLVLFLLFINPLFFKLKKKLSFRPTEIAVILAIVLPACAIPGGNFMRLFTGSLILPFRTETTEVSWQQYDIVDKMPAKMLADVEGNEQVALNGFIRGLGVGSEGVSLGDIPWGAWTTTLAFWLPLVLILWLCLTALSIILHRQWAHNEHLPYPLVTFTRSILPGPDGGASPIFHNRGFWIACATVLAIHLYNFAFLWFPDQLFNKIVLGIDFSSLSPLFPLFDKGGGSIFLSSNAAIYLTVIAVAFFLPKDVTLSMGIGPFLFICVEGFLITYGFTDMQWTGGYNSGINLKSTLVTGAYIGLLMTILYNGRFYYGSVLRNIFGSPGREVQPPLIVWSGRFFILTFVIFVSMLASTGLDPVIATLFAILTVAFFVVLGRIMAETGLFFIQLIGGPVMLLWAILGAKALGPETMLILLMLALILQYDTRESIMPFLMNSMKLAEDCKVKLNRTAILVGGGLLVGMMVAVPATMFFQYNEGVDLQAWRNEQSKVPFQDTVGAMQRLEAQGQLEEAGSVTGLARLAQLRPHKPALFFGGSVALLVGLFSFLRLRVPAWPFHPILFITWTTYAGHKFALSFLLGWMIKAGVTKYGGAHIYQKIKPIMIGVIAGEMLGGFIPIIISWIYYCITGNTPEQFFIFPG